MTLLKGIKQLQTEEELTYDTELEIGIYCMKQKMNTLDLTAEQYERLLNFYTAKATNYLDYKYFISSVEISTHLKAKIFKKQLESLGVEENLYNLLLKPNNMSARCMLFSQSLKDLLNVKKEQRIWYICDERFNAVNLKKYYNSMADYYMFLDMELINDWLET